MHVLVLVKATEESEKGITDTPEIQAMMEEMDRYNHELMKAGILKSEADCNGLKPSSTGKRVRFDGTDRSVIDGPFANSNELVAGYWLWTVKDIDEAVEWVKRCPNPMMGPSEIEIRPIDDMA